LSASWSSRSKSIYHLHSTSIFIRQEAISVEIDHSDSAVVDVIETIELAEVSTQAPATADKWMTWADAFVVVFSVTNSDTFDDIPALMQKIKSRNALAPLTLLGTKSKLKE
jgi:hypothetical protein